MEGRPLIELLFPDEGAVAYETFASRLHATRRGKGLTLTALAAAAGVSRQMLTRYESGAASPTEPVITALAAALGVPSAVLMPGNPFPDA